MLRNQYLLEYLEQQATLLILEFDSQERRHKMKAHAADQMDQGRIWAVSEPGKGATFNFYLPGFEPMEQP